MFENKLGVLMAGAAGLFLLGTLATVVLPFTDTSMTTPTASAELRDYKPDSAEARGRDVYIANGCNTCHTQYVRPVKADANLGPVSQPGDYYFDTPHLLGSNRMGPDLMWIGQRQPSEDWHRRHLHNPRDTSPGSIMPAYDYLSDQETNDLIAYLLSLKPAAPGAKSEAEKKLEAQKGASE
ncbi:MAG TPA: cbb3-type cytochrome c oxidase subunit II [Bacilli bacterium]|nr:cbb3-type cytochrome c oxidase subunit II [Bacilli bacterium]